MAEPQVFVDKAAMRAFSRAQRAAGRRVALVPTMGYLHEGHLALVRAAKELADVVVVSIYVNPTQFAAHEDFGVYPRQRERDRALLAGLGVQATFEPDSLYESSATGGEAGNVVGAQAAPQPGSHETFIQVEQLQRGLCGVSRPHFFRGVATVVAKLFHIVEPDVAVFGRKDYQQWRIIRRMVRDLDFAVEVVGLPIVREPDGLAMSSRNALLTPEDRRKALVISQSLQWAGQAVGSGQAGAADQLCAEVARRIEEAGGAVDYVQVVDAEELRPVADARTQATLLAVAAKFGSVRLIDNAVLGAAYS